MRGSDVQIHRMFRYNSPETFVPQDHPLHLLAQARSAKLLSDEHFTVDGTLMEAWASLKSFRLAGQALKESGLAVHAGGCGVQLGADAELGTGEHVVTGKRRAVTTDTSDQAPRNGAMSPEM